MTDPSHADGPTHAWEDQADATVATPLASADGSGPGRPSRRRFSPRQIVGLAVVVVMAGVIVATSIVLASLGILPPVITWSIIGADVLLGVLIGLALLTVGRHGHKVRFSIALALAVLLSVGNLVGLKLGADYAHFVNQLQPTPEAVQYDIIGRADGPTDLAAIIGAEVPADSTDDLYQAVVNHVRSVVSVVVIGLVGQPALIDAVINQQAKAAIVQDNYYQDLDEVDPATYGQLIVLATFSVPVSEGQAPVSPTPTPTLTPTSAPNGAYIVYISGIDVAGPISTRSRSDVNIVMVVNPTTGQVLLVNTPRDFYVQLAGIDTPLKDKLTHSGVYGITTSIGTISDLYDITINYYLRVNFSSLVTVIDTLGGVDVNSAYDFTAIGGYHFHQGVNHLDGAAALAFSRERHAFAGGDRIRGQNQERVIAAIIAKLTDPSVLIHYDQILAAVSGAVQTSMTPTEISDQVQHQLSSGTKWQVTSIAVDGTGASEYTYSYPHQRLYVMVPDQATVDAAKAQIQAVLTAS